MRVERRFAERFLSFNDPAYVKAVRAARKQSAPEPPQQFIFHGHRVTTQYWSGSVRGEDLRDEIEARRASVRIVSVESRVIYRLWPIDVFVRLPLRTPERVPPATGTSASSEVESPPQSVEIRFQTGAPALHLRVIAAGPQACASLFNYIAPYLEAGGRPKVWEPEAGAATGTVLGAAVPDVLLATGVVPPWWAMAFQILLGAIG
jgi:hypothetical protein